MNLGRHSITSTPPLQISDVRFESDSSIFTTCVPAGFAVYRTYPLALLKKRHLTGGTLAMAFPMQTSSLIFLVGGGASPLYPPNKVVLWDVALDREVAELEFRERVRGLACRHGWLAVSLRRRVVVFEVGEAVKRYNEWDTYDNPNGIVAMATASSATLLGILGHKMGHVQLIHLPPCKRRPKDPPSKRQSTPAARKNPVSIIVAHTTALSTLSLPPSGRLLATTSARGTLVRIWDTHTGSLVRELRRGTDKAEIFGTAFRPDEKEICVWSDKGTVHIFSLEGSTASNRQSSLSTLTPYLPLPKYFESEWSYAQYRIPTRTSHIALSSTSSRSTSSGLADDERCTIGWIEGPRSDDSSDRPHYQLIALTYTGGWHRLALPSHSSSAVPSDIEASADKTRRRSGSRASVLGRFDKGKSKDKPKESSECVLQEFRRFGRWDGWG